MSILTNTADTYECFDRITAGRLIIAKILNFLIGIFLFVLLAPCILNQNHYFNLFLVYPQQ